MRKKEDISLFVFLVFLLLVLNYSFLDSALVKFIGVSKEVHVDRVIDGDTIVSGNESIRLLGINTPERGEFLYEEAKTFLESLVLNETVRLEFVGERKDKYKRTLAYIFLGAENVNVKMVENGFANYYFYNGRDKHSNSLEDAWKVCLDNEVNLCEKSDNLCAPCVNLTSNSIINSCNFSCDITNWTIKGEGREKYIFNITLSQNEKTGFALNLEDSGGSLYLQDDEGRLVVWESF